MAPKLHSVLSPGGPLAPTLTADASQPAVEVRGFTRRFDLQTVLEGLDLSIGPGEFVALLGRSGSGKTTLLRALSGLDPVDPGAVRVTGRPAVVFQEPRLMPWKRVAENVTLGLRRADAPALAERALAEVGLSHRLAAWPATLSGGEAQRAALARALVREPKLLLLDEPFAALDALTRLKMHELVLSLWRAHAPAILLVTHDVDEAVTLADRVLVLDQGRIAVEEPVALPRPREVDASFQAIRRRLLAHLGVGAPGASVRSSRAVFPLPLAESAA